MKAKRFQITKGATVGIIVHDKGNTKRESGTVESVSADGAWLKLADGSSVEIFFEQAAE